jgi:proteic killer suppression protein
MEVVFEKEYLQELYEKGKTSDKKHWYQPQVVKGYLKCIIDLYEAEQIEDFFRSNSLN